MAVQKIQSAVQVIAVLEKIAEHQPVGVTELSKITGDTKSNLQRALVTLAETKWIRMAPGKPTRWELSERIHMIAHKGQSHSDLRNRARAPLDALRQETGETVILAVPEDNRFIVVEAFESRQLVRTSAAIGMVFPVRDSASGLAMLAHLDAADQAALLGEKPDKTLLAKIEHTRHQGYALNDEALITGSTNVGAAILVGDRPVAAIVVGAPSERMPRSTQRKIAALVVKAARLLSRGTATP